MAIGRKEKENILKAVIGSFLRDSSLLGAEDKPTVDSINESGKYDFDNSFENDERATGGSEVAEENSMTNSNIINSASKTTPDRSKISREPGQKENKLNYVPWVPKTIHRRRSDVSTSIQNYRLIGANENEDQPIWTDPVLTPTHFKPRWVEIDESGGIKEIAGRGSIGGSQENRMPFNTDKEERPNVAGSRFEDLAKRLLGHNGPGHGGLGEEVEPHIIFDNSDVVDENNQFGKKTEIDNQDGEIPAVVSQQIAGGKADFNEVSDVFALNEDNGGSENALTVDKMPPAINNVAGDGGEIVFKDADPDNPLSGTTENLKRRIGDLHHDDDNKKQRSSSSGGLGGAKATQENSYNEHDPIDTDDRTNNQQITIDTINGSAISDNIDKVEQPEQLKINPGPNLKLVEDDSLPVNNMGAEQKTRGDNPLNPLNSEDSGHNTDLRFVGEDVAGKEDANGKKYNPPVESMTNSDQADATPANIEEVIANQETLAGNQVAGESQASEIGQQNERVPSINQAVHEASSQPTEAASMQPEVNEEIKNVNEAQAENPEPIKSEIAPPEQKEVAPASEAAEAADSVQFGPEVVIETDKTSLDQKQTKAADEVAAGDGPTEYIPAEQTEQAANEDRSKENEPRASWLSKIFGGRKAREMHEITTNGRLVTSQDLANLGHHAKKGKPAEDEVLPKAA